MLWGPVAASVKIINDAAVVGGLRRVGRLFELGGSKMLMHGTVSACYGKRHKKPFRGYTQKKQVKSSQEKVRGLQVWRQWLF